MYLFCRLVIGSDCTALSDGLRLCRGISCLRDALCHELRECREIAFCYIASEFRMPDEAIEPNEFQSQFVRHELAEVAKTEIVAVSAVENILRRIVGVHGQSARIAVGKTPLLETRKAAQGRAGVIFRWIKTRNLEC